MAGTPTGDDDGRAGIVDPVLDRRRLLAALGATGLPGIGGCLGDDGTGSTPTGETPTTTPSATNADDKGGRTTTTDSEKPTEETADEGPMTETVEFTADHATDMFPDNQYTPVATHGDHAYFVWIREDYRPAVAKIPEGDGETTTRPVDPEPDYEVFPDGHHKFSIGVDSDGYVHVAGDMHHGGDPWYRKNGDEHPPLPDRYEPGNLLYWVSDEPEDVSSFTFRGDPDDPRSIPAWQPSYLFFETDTEGTLYAAARVNLPRREGRHRELGAGVYRYDAGEKRWTALGGPAPFEDPTGANVPGIFDAVPAPKTVLWSPEGGAREEGWYQPYQVSVRFDASNRLHLAVGVNAERHGPDVTHVLYAYSDDGGETFRRADDTRIDLPITPEPGSQQGSIVRSPDDPAGLDGIWHYVFHDGSGTPAVATRNADGFSGYVYYQPSEGSWSDFVFAPINSGTARLEHYTDPDGSITFVGTQEIHRTADFETEGETYQLWDWLRCVDTSLLRREGRFRGVVSTRESEIAVQTVNFS